MEGYPKMSKAELLKRLEKLEEEGLEKLGLGGKGNTDMESGLGRILWSSLNEIYVFDQHTLKFGMVNGAALQNLGYSSEELREMTPMDIKPEFLPEEFNRLVEPLRSGGKGKIQFRTVHLRKDGSTYPVEVHLELTKWRGTPAFMAISLDLTDRQQMEEQFRIVVESVANGIVMANAQGKIVLVNSQTEKYFGYVRGELVGQSVDILLPERFRSRHSEFREGFVADPHARSMGGGRDLYGLRKDGSEFPVEVGLSPVETEEGVYVLAVIVDITDRKELETKILEISESEKRRIGEDIHDDLCQQLAAIGCLTKVLEKKIASTSSENAGSVAEIGTMISKAHARAREVARGLITGTLQTDGLEAALRELAGSTETLFDVRCDFNCDGGLRIEEPKAAVHFYRIAQEAISNAVRHGKAKRIEIGIKANSGRLELVVQDDGVGFEQPAEGHKGLGLLTMAHRAKMMNGDLEIGRGENGGTKVFCSAPVAGR